MGCSAVEGSRQMAPRTTIVLFRTATGRVCVCTGRIRAPAGMGFRWGMARRGIIGVIGAERRCIRSVFITSRISRVIASRRLAVTRRRRRCRMGIREGWGQWAGPWSWTKAKREILVSVRWFSLAQKRLIYSWQHVNFALFNKIRFIQQTPQIKSMFEWTKIADSTDSNKSQTIY